MTQKTNEPTPFNILAYAISDAGLWTWWVEKLPDVIQLEFDRTMLYLEPNTPGLPPSNQIAIRFDQPKSVTIIKKSNCTLPDNWIEEFRTNKLGPFDIDVPNFSFDHQDIENIMKQADKTETIFGEQVNETNLKNASVKLGFWTFEVGVIILADKMKIITHKGEIPLEQIADKHYCWWDYWRHYWSVRETDKALPYDPLCEIIIPLANE